MIETIHLACPTRNRPYKAFELFESWESTITSVERNDITFIVDYDDPQLDEYLKLAKQHREFAVFVYAGESSYPAKMNSVSLFDKGIMGFIADDLRFRTDGWDIAIEEALKNGGMAYGDSLGYSNLPAAIFVTPEITEALGFIALPGLRHLYVDNFWYDLGTKSGVLKYVPEVIIEHMHPVFGKGEYDENYAIYHKQENWDNDQEVYRTWLDFNADGMAERVRTAVNERRVNSLRAG